MLFYAVYHTTNVTRSLNVVSMLANIDVGQELTQCANVKSLMCDHSAIRMLILEHQNVRYCGVFIAACFRSHPNNIYKLTIYTNLPNVLFVPNRCLRIQSESWKSILHLGE